MKYQDEFSRYLLEERGMAKASLGAYTSDLEEFSAYVSSRGKTVESAGNADVAAFLMKLRNEGRSASTVNRKLASLRAYFTYLRREKVITDDPTSGIKSPRIERKSVDFLTVEEVDRLLTSPDESPKGVRDRALLELMYAAGLRAGEIITIKVRDLNLKIGFVSVTQENGKTRIIPVGKPARAALSAYLDGVRDSYITDKEEDDGILFVNYRGESLTRQGVWKILKYYGEKSGLENRISPQILRNSFAAHMVQNGADLKSLQEIMGYEDVMAARIYVSLTKNRIMDVYDRAFPRA